MCSSPTVPFCPSRTDRILAISGNALTDFFLQDVGITQFQFNIGQQLLSAGIVLLEVNTNNEPLRYGPLTKKQIPSNIILYRVGPAGWIGGQIIAW